jgi:hypothetical protein
MPAATELVSLVEAQEYLGADESKLERLERVVLAALRFCEKTIGGGKILSADYVDVLDGSGSNELTLLHDPVTAVTKIEQIRTTVPVAWDELTAAAYPVVILTPGRRRIAFRNAIFCRGIQNWQVTYTAGYGDADGVAPLDEDLKEAALQVCGALWRAPEIQAAQIASISMNGQTTTYLNEAVPKQTISLLKGFRRRRWR